MKLKKRDTYRGSPERVSEKRSGQQSRPVTPSDRRRWVIESYVPSQRSSRKVLLKSAATRLSQIVPQCVAVIEDFARTKDDDEDYDSDEGDRRNGVTVTVSRGQGCPLTADMVADASQELEEKLGEKRQFQELLSNTKRRYLAACNWFAKTRGADWDALTRVYFRMLEDKYFFLDDRCLKLEYEVNRLEAMLLCYGHGKPVTPTRKWTLDNGGSRVRSSSTATFDWETPDDIFRHEYDSKDIGVV